MEFKFTPASISDLDGIYDYILEASGSGAADKVVTEIQRVVKTVLAESPMIGTRATVHIEDLFFFPASAYPKYGIYFTVDHDVLTIVRVLHGQRDIENLLRG